MRSAPARIGPRVGVSRRAWVTALFVVVLVLGVVDESGDLLQAPLKGFAVILWACALIAIGAVGRSWRAVVLAVLAAGAPVPITWSWASEGDDFFSVGQATCDPGCTSGLDLMVFLMVLGLALSALGRVARLLIRVGRRSPSR